MEILNFLATCETESRFEAVCQEPDELADIIFTRRCPIQHLLPNDIIMRIIKESTQEQRELDNWKRDVSNINGELMSHICECQIAQTGIFGGSWDDLIEDDDPENEFPTYTMLLGQGFSWGRRAVWEMVDEMEGNDEEIPLSLARCVGFMDYRS
tara:strand:+ start:132 stop:593 length:462 start_codon:yes stop_codon:yes gene_type:complete